MSQETAIEGGWGGGRELDGGGGGGGEREREREREGKIYIII